MGKQSEQRICMAGVDYRTAPVSVRGKLAIPQHRMQEALIFLKRYISSGVILATCNRTEIYTVDRSADENILSEFLRHWSSLPQDDLTPYLRDLQDEAAIRELFGTASGLNSMIVGEHEILGQVKQALEEADAADMLNLPLRGLFQQAVSVGGKVREETGIGRNALSVSSVAVDVAAKVVEDIHNAKAVLIGAGQAGQLAMKALARRGASRLSIVSRSVERVQQLASTIGGNAANMSQMRDEIADADIVITCTAAPHYIVHYEDIRRVMSSRPDRKVAIVDIAVPADVEPGVEGFENVFVYNIDDLQGVSEANRKQREYEIGRAESIIDSEVQLFLEWWKELAVRPVIRELMQMADGVRRKQLSLTLKKLPPLSQEQKDDLDAMTKSIVNKILQSPLQHLKNNGNQTGDYAQMVMELFDLDERNKNE